jgi:hypothetical protein
VSTRNVYLHEYIDIVGEGAMPYMEHTVERGAGDASGGTLELVGTWYTMGSTGRWPQVVNLWECVDGWEGWRRLMERTNLRRTRTPELEAWWRRALELRTSGFDRVLAGAPGCTHRCSSTSSRDAGPERPSTTSAQSAASGNPSSLITDTPSSASTRCS